MNGQFIINPNTDPDYLSAIKIGQKCFLPTGKVPFDYIPFSPINPKSTTSKPKSPSFSECVSAEKVGLIPRITNLLVNNSYPDLVMYPLVFYTAYIAKLQKNISAIVKSRDENAVKSLLKILKSTNFVYNDGKQQFSIQLDELILYVSTLLGNAFNTGKYAKELHLDFLCNFSISNNERIGILQKTIPLLLEDFTKIGFSNVPASLSVIEASPLNGPALKNFINA